MSDKLSLVIPALNEEANIRELVPRLHQILEREGVEHEILVVDSNSSDRTQEAARELGAIALNDPRRGYGHALRLGFAKATGNYILTMDADLSHPPEFIVDMWKARHSASIIIASRYVAGGRADMPWHRYMLSRILNSFFAIGLGLPIRDMSSGFRLYKSSVIRALDIQLNQFEVLEEILFKAYGAGCAICEVPFYYQPRKAGSSHARIFQFGIRYLKLFVDLRLNKPNYMVPLPEEPEAAEKLDK